MEIAVAFRPAMGFPEAAARLEAAGGRIVREGGIDSVFIVAFDEAGWNWAKVWRAGGWLALDPIVAGACAQRV